jgi:hypothetical protein
MPFGHCSTAALEIRIHMKDWNGKEIKTAKSMGGVCVVAHPYDNLISTGCSPWPTPEIVQKLYQSRQVRAFHGDQLVICKSGLGYYSDLQSLHSEDAITWSVFGTVARTQQEKLETWLADLLQLFGMSAASPDRANIFLWRRIPHPDTMVSGGPEIDVGIMTINSVIFIEAKWKSEVGKKQGKNKTKDQIQLRREFLKEYGPRLFPKASIFGVFGLSMLPNSFANTTPQEVSFKCATWEKICSLGSHPYADEVQRYFQWKKDNSRMPNNGMQI